MILLIVCIFLAFAVYFQFNLKYLITITLLPHNSLIFIYSNSFQFENSSELLTKIFFTAIEEGVGNENIIEELSLKIAELEVFNEEIQVKFDNEKCGIQEEKKQLEAKVADLEKEIEELKLSIKCKNELFLFYQPGQYPIPASLKLLYFYFWSEQLRDRGQIK